MSASRRTGPLTVSVLAAVLTLAGCDSKEASVADSGHPGPEPSASAGDAGRGTAKPAVTSATSAASASPASCRSGQVVFVHHPGDPWEVAWCVKVGATITLTLEPGRGYRWTTVGTSAPRLAEVTATETDRSGTGHATVSVHDAGEAVLSASTSFTPDPNGPPTRLWRLALHIVK
ncbi:MAG: hypothetical protein JWN52_5014 [Actinomycetia bacterium]|nr:hypothetical protein [Actinomycetes bacterium]